MIADVPTGYAVERHGHGHVGTFDNLELAYQAVKEDAGDHFRPNVWMVSDHGNYSLVENFPWDVTIELG